MIDKDNPKRFKIISLSNGKKYYLSKLLFIIVCVCSLLILSYAALLSGLDGKDHFYSYCDKKNVGGCFNGFYHDGNCGLKIPSDDPICTTEHMPAGSFLGEPPNPLIKYLHNSVWELLVLGLVINHFLFNRDSLKGFNLHTEGLK